MFRIVSLSECSAILIGAVYSVTGVGATGENLELLDYIAGVALASPWPFVLGGDGGTCATPEKTSLKVQLRESLKQPWREYRAKQRKKRTCSHCGTTAPFSARAFPYCGGCRHPKEGEPMVVVEAGQADRLAPRMAPGRTFLPAPVCNEELGGVAPVWCGLSFVYCVYPMY